MLDQYVHKLFLEKRFSELVFFLENNDDEKNSKILNVLGVSRILTNKNEKNLNLSIKDFENSYLKEKKTKNGLDGLINFINAVIDLYSLDKSNQMNIDYSYKFNQCIKYYEEAEIFFGNNQDLIIAIIRVYKRLNILEKILFYYDILLKEKKLNLNVIVSLIFYNNYTKKWSQKDFYNYSQLVEKYSKEYPKEKLVNLKKSFKKESIIKVGFLSSDIVGNHSITYFLKSIFQNYEKDKFEIYLFLSNKIDDENTLFFKKLVNKSYKIYNLNDLDSINLIRNCKIDIIFDLNGLTSFHRTSLLKNRLAPIQISWLGYCNTIGLKQIDYLIADKNLIYPDEQKYYNEKIIYLPDIWSSHCGFEFKKGTTKAPLLSNEYITFGSFNNYSKINKNVLSVWSLILSKIKDSRLILKSSVKREISEIKKYFIERDIEKKVIFYDKDNSFESHLNLYNEIDIALDTFPYNGVTTTFESLWMNVPVLTMKGYNFNSRCGESIIKNLGVNELIAQNEKDYVDKAIDLSKDKKKLENLKKIIYEKSISSPLFDSKKFSINFFNLIKKVYLENC